MSLPAIDITNRAHGAESAARIVHLTSVHRATDLRIFGRECRTLARAGFEVTLLAPHDGDQWLDGVFIKAVPRPRNRFERMTRTVWLIYREALRMRADVYHFHDPELIPAGLMLRAAGKHVIYDMHENVPHQILGGDDKKWIPRSFRRPISWLFSAVEKNSASHFSAVVTANTEISRHAQTMNQHVVLIGNYPEAAEFRDFTGAPGRYHSGRIANFGGISYRTCTQQLVDALGILPPSVRATMVLAGSSTTGALEAEISSKPGWSRVQFIGPQPRPVMLDELRHAAITTVLFSPAPNHLGIGSNRFYEALAAGLPVLVSNFPKWQAMIDRLQCGFAVDPTNPSAIAAALEHLLTHPEEAAEMGARGRQAFLNQYCWDAEEPKLLSLYRRLSAA